MQFNLIKRKSYRNKKKIRIGNGAKKIGLAGMVL